MHSRLRQIVRKLILEGLSFNGLRGFAKTLLEVLGKRSYVRPVHEAAHEWIMMNHEHRWRGGEQGLSTKEEMELCRGWQLRTKGAQRVWKLMKGDLKKWAIDKFENEQYFIDTVGNVIWAVTPLLVESGGKPGFAIDQQEFGIPSKARNRVTRNKITNRSKKLKKFRRHIPRHPMDSTVHVIDLSNIEFADHDPMDLWQQILDGGCDAYAKIALLDITKDIESTWIHELQHIVQFSHYYSGPKGKGVPTYRKYVTKKPFYKWAKEEGESYDSAWGDQPWERDAEFASHISGKIEFLISKGYGVHWLWDDRIDLFSSFVVLEVIDMLVQRNIHDYSKKNLEKLVKRVAKYTANALDKVDLKDHTDSADQINKIINTEWTYKGTDLKKIIEDSKKFPWPPSYLNAVIRKSQGL